MDTELYSSVKNILIVRLKNLNRNVKNILIAV